MTVFLQFWYWFPFTHFISLSLAPKALIGVNNLLKVPQSFKFTCNAKKSLFDYPEHLKTEQKEAKKETTKVELSITNKAKARAAKKAHDKDGMEIEPGLSKVFELLFYLVILFYYFRVLASLLNSLKLRKRRK